MNTLKFKLIVNCDMVPAESVKETVKVSPERL